MSKPREPSNLERPHHGVSVSDVEPSTLERLTVTPVNRTERPRVSERRTMNRPERETVNAERVRLLRNSPTSTNVPPCKSLPAKTPVHFPPSPGRMLSPAQTPIAPRQRHLAIHPPRHLPEHPTAHLEARPRPRNQHSAVPSWKTKTVSPERNKTDDTAKVK